MTQLLGSVIADRYRLESELGQGGMGIVYQATDLLLERPVAVKMVSGAQPGTEGRARLLAEARAAARLNHPNIVAIHDAGEYNQVPFVVMELVQGQTLRQIERPGLEEALKVSRDICAALDHAHQNGIIHRDVKPENVVLTQSRVAKLMDFGLAYDPGRSRLTGAGMLMGTMAYLAPELIMGQPASVQSDLYALGVMLYEMTAGRPPFEGDNAAVLLTNHLHAVVVPPSAYNPAIPPMLDALVVVLLEKEPARRPVSAAVVLARLDDIAQPAPGDLPFVPEVPAASLLDSIARGRLVGRAEQLAQGTQFWLRALSGQAGLLLISGEPGIGKTRLAQAIMAQARVAGAAILSGGCYEFEATTPYLPLAEALRDWVHEQNTETMRAVLGGTATELARLVPEIATRLGPLPPSPSLGPQEQRLRLFEMFAQFLDNLADEKGLLLFVDDLHWADQGTLAVLSYLMRRLRQAPLLILAGYREVELDRNHPLAEALVQWNRQRQVSRIQLARFTVAESNALIATLFGQERVSDEFAAAIFRETEGNPFFIEEVIKALVDQGQIYRAGDHWERDELDELAIPQSIKEAIGRRLNHLGRMCVDILHTAAVIGKDFSYPLLAAVAGETEDQILDALEEAIVAQLLRPLTGEAFIFTHDKIREVLYDEILSIRRHRLHRRIAQALEAERDEGRAAPIEDLAYHTIAGGVLDKGLEYALLAAQNTQNMFAADEALVYYRQAQECAISLGDTLAQGTILEAMGDVYSVSGPMIAAVDHYQQAVALLPEIRQQATIWVKIGGVYNVMNDERGITILEQALAELDPEKQPLDVAQALAHLGRYHHYRGEYSVAISYFERALVLAEPLSDPLTLSIIYSNLAGAFQHLARFEDSMAWAATVIALGETSGYLMAIAFGQEFMAENYAIMGHWEKALVAAGIDRQIGERIGSSARIAWGQWCFGFGLAGKGELRQAAAELRQALDLATTIDEKRLEVLAELLLALVSIDMGDEGAAFEYLDSALEKSQHMNELFGKCYLLQLKGYIHLQRGDLAKAAADYSQTVDLLAGSEIKDVFLYFLPYQAEISLLMGDQEEAMSILEESLLLANEATAPQTEAITQRVLGQLLATQGDFVGAAAAFDQAISLATEIGSRLVLGRTYYHRALMHELQGRSDLAVLDGIEAQAIFTDCNAARDLNQANDLLGRLQ